MCFYINEKSNERYLKNHGHKETVKVYKVLRLGRGGPCTPVRNVLVKAGLFRAKGKTDKAFRDEVITGGAIHVYISKQYAMSSHNIPNEPNYIVVECLARISDFIGANYDHKEAVFKAITIPDLSKYTKMKKKESV
jgi:hypothetical protein